MKKAFLLLSLLLLPLLAKAVEVEINGIKYDINTETQTAEVIANDNKYSGDIVIPSKIEYQGVFYSVTEIGANAFKRCTGLTSVIIPNSVTIIGEDAFYRCTGLTSIDIPDSVTSIGKGAFSSCFGFTSFTIPNSVTSIDERVCSGCSGLTSVTIPKSVTTIGDYAFRG